MKEEPEEEKEEHAQGNDTRLCAHSHWQCTLTCPSLSPFQPMIVPCRKDAFGLPAFMESDQIHVAGLIVANLSRDHR